MPIHAPAWDNGNQGQTSQREQPTVLWLFGWSWRCFPEPGYGEKVQPDLRSYVLTANGKLYLKWQEHVRHVSVQPRSIVCIQQNKCILGKKDVDAIHSVSKWLHQTTEQSSRLVTSASIIGVWVASAESACGSVQAQPSTPLYAISLVQASPPEVAADTSLCARYCSTKDRSLAGMLHTSGREPYDAAPKCLLIPNEPTETLPRNGLMKCTPASVQRTYRQSQHQTCHSAKWTRPCWRLIVLCQISFNYNHDC